MKPGGRGRPSGLQPLHAALMIREGRYDVAGGSKLSDDAKLTAAATAYGVNRDAIKDKLDKLAHTMRRPQARRRCFADPGGCSRAAVVRPRVRV